MTSKLSIHLALSRHDYQHLPRVTLQLFAHERKSDCSTLLKPCQSVRNLMSKLSISLSTSLATPREPAPVSALGIAKILQVLGRKHDLLGQYYSQQKGNVLSPWIGAHDNVSYVNLSILVCFNLRPVSINLRACLVVGYFLFSWTNLGFTFPALLTK